MIPKGQHLNPHLLDDDVERVAIRKGFGEGLLHAGEDNDQVVGLCADLTGSTKMQAFADKFPERFVQIGVAEQNLASVASGLAAMGKIPFISSYAMFSPGRNWEQIRTTICYNNVPVKIAGSHAGVSVGPDGGTHQAIEDIAITRVIPRMVVVSPCDHIEARKATMVVAKTDQPTYLRLAREGTPVITTDETPFKLGKAAVFFESEGDTIDVGIIATGALVHKALKVAHALYKAGTKVIVVNVSTIKPLDEILIGDVAKRAGAIVTVEEHQVAGGLGSAVAEYLAKTNPTPQEFVGVRNHFGQSGEPEELIAHYEMDEKAIEKAVGRVLSRKNK